MRVSEIRVNQIRVNQGLGVLFNLAMKIGFWGQVIIFANALNAKTGKLAKILKKLFFQTLPTFQFPPKSIVI